MIQLTVNGKKQSVDADPATPLLWVIREQLGMTGTKFGCGIAQCGACTVLINGEAVRSCSLPVSALQAGQKITTIEGIAGTVLHPLQQAFIDLDVPQCGYCQSGQLMAAAALLSKNPKPDDALIDQEMTNICRCGTYNRIRAAIKQASAHITQKA